MPGFVASAPYLNEDVATSHAVIVALFYHKIPAGGLQIRKLKAKERSGVSRAPWLRRDAAHWR